MLQRGVLQVGKAKEEEKDDHQGAITHNEEKPTSHTHIRILTEHFTDEYTDSSNMPLGKQPFSHSTNQLMNQILSIRWLGRHPATTLLLLITALIKEELLSGLSKSRKEVGGSMVLSPLIFGLSTKLAGPLTVPILRR